MTDATYPFLTTFASDSPAPPASFTVNPERTA
jgi:hypothetical protein